MDDHHLFIYLFIYLFILKITLVQGSVVYKK